MGCGAGHLEGADELGVAVGACGADDEGRWVGRVGHEMILDPV